MSFGHRLIEDYLPIEAISAEASREKSVRKGHISTLHLWWARRPLVACRAAVYGALVPASRFVPENGPDNKKQSLGRANAAKFVKRLCRYPSNAKPEERADIERAVAEAQSHILEAHAERLTQELADWKAGKLPKPRWVDEFKWKGEKVTINDISGGNAPRPRVLDMFAGGGAIPLEALRLGCEAYALDLNPVAHIIELCTLVYPQKYGKPDASARGMTGPKNEKDETTWGGLADEVRYWGNWVLKRVKAEIGDLYPLIPDPDYKGKRPDIELDRETGEWVISRKGVMTQGEDDPFAPPQRVMSFAEDAQLRLSTQSAGYSPKFIIPPGYLMPVAYLWTRTVKCKNPACGAIVPLVKQTWLCKKEGKKDKKGRISSPGRYVAMKMVAPKAKKQVRFEVVEALTEKGLGFDPEAFSKAGNSVCPFCGTVADTDYVKDEGCAGRLDKQLMAVAGTRSGARGKVYLPVKDMPDSMPDEPEIKKRLDILCRKTGLTLPDEPMDPQDPTTVAGRGFGIKSWNELFTIRQSMSLLSFIASIGLLYDEAENQIFRSRQQEAIFIMLAIMVDKLADYSSSGCLWNYTGGRGVKNTFARQALPMSWDYSETNPFNPDGASWIAIADDIPIALDMISFPSCSAHVQRGSATSIPWNDGQMDAVITDPPYYDNISYAVLSDYFYVWLKRSIGSRFTEHFSSALTPKKNEAISDASRHGSHLTGSQHYEKSMHESFKEAFRVLKHEGYMVVVYAHKTTLGWATLVDSLRQAGFAVNEAWPLDTEKAGRMIALDASALASSIFLVAQKREESSKAGNYEEDVVPELGCIVRERVETLWEMGISGADLVIACVGAGLRAFTKYARVEYANGEEVPAERFLAEVEAIVLETILGKLSKTIGAKNGQASLVGLDPSTRFYVLWRYTYGGAELDAGEAIIFAHGTHVELDGQHGMSYGKRAMLEKKKSKYRLLDYTERGNEDHLGQPSGDGTSAPAVDILHRLLWLMEHKPPKIPDFLNEARPNVEQLRLVAQALSGPALKGGELANVSSTAEQSALGKLLSNWNAVVVGKAIVANRQAGQAQLF